jgi:GNAT superfamily N-acetyltransferase
MEATEETYNVIRANHDNINLLSQLFFEVKGVLISTSYLQKKFNTQYTGKTYIAHFAVTSEGRPAAFFCLFPCLIIIDGEKHLAGQSADIITHPDHQRKGLFGKLGKITEELAVKEGINYVFAFPNENSFPGFYRSLSWNHQGNFKVFAFKKKHFPIYRILHKLRLKRLYNAYSDFILRKAEPPNGTFKSSDQSGAFNCCYRTDAYFIYKHYNPSFMLNWQGLRIWAKIEGQLIIGDMERADDFSIELIVRKILSLAKALGLEQFTFEVSDESYWHSRFKEIAVPTDGVPIVNKNLVDSNQRLTLAFTSGDADVF